MSTQQSTKVVTKSCSPMVESKSIKVTARHLERSAFIYVRQSSLQQVVRHTESVRLQYDLEKRAVDLGWPKSKVEVIDDDQGLSGATAEGRPGFQRLLSEVSLDHAGIIFGIDMSRLARSCRDWYQLLELCGIFGCLLGDVDGVYDPTNYNDRLLLGLKGTMSEAELHMIRNRLWSGKLNKARRGALFGHVPTGYVRLPNGEVAFDPDEEVVAAVRAVFDKFDALGVAHAVVRSMRSMGLRLGFRTGGDTAEHRLEWRYPGRSTIAAILKNPFYAGIYAYGRRQGDARRRVPGHRHSGVRTNVPRKEWYVYLPDALPAYITKERHESNLKRLRTNATRFGGTGASRDGAALLQGLLFCKKCGGRIPACYSKGGFFQYQCNRAYVQRGEPLCQSFSGQVVDKLVSHEVLEAVKPASLELNIATTQRMAEEHRATEAMWLRRLERARYEADRAKRQYDLVEPENRLVARSLEAAWESALEEEANLRQDYERFRRTDPTNMSEDVLSLVRALSSDIPALWYAPTTSNSDRKTIVRHLIERVEVDTLDAGDLADVEIHWHGGVSSLHRISHHVRSYKRRHDYAALVHRISVLRNRGYTSSEIADHLNKEGFTPAKNAKEFKNHTIQGIIQHSDLPKICDQTVRLQPFLQRDEWPLSALANELDIPYQTLHSWLRKGWLQARWLEQRQGRWLVWANKKERNRLRKKYENIPQNHWRVDHDPNTKA